ncbi:hypothetical protein BU14_0113s0040 [Porphyra umbilicalis]|uniref:Uncharacterized protein n=1 Tax=Porphyra umbilicalis TaxID=2786 RepID=A0A1X6PC29_PORUM|nr:hypothetical protein BU14_0113s0040 [Porphyra umbilicalis]|eukprot:OSX78296.1 hypothetical protein BU14_0113s0040 [Porphyra umbilicalis]
MASEQQHCTGAHGARCSQLGEAHEPLSRPCVGDFGNVTPSTRTALARMAPDVPFPDFPTPPKREVPLSAFPDHPIAVALREDCLSRRWLLPEVGPTPVAPADHGGGAATRQPEGMHCLPAGLSREGLAQAVGVTAAIAGRDGSCVKHVHMILVPYASVNGVTLGVFVLSGETPLSASAGAARFARFVLNEATRTLVAVGPDPLGGGVTAYAVAGRAGARDGTGGAAPHPAPVMMRLGGPGAAGVCGGHLTVRQRAEVLPPSGWAPAAAAGGGGGGAAAAAAASAADPPAWPTSPVDFGGFDAAVRALLGAVVVRRGHGGPPAHPAADDAAGPPPLARGRRPRLRLVPPSPAGATTTAAAAAPHRVPLRLCRQPAAAGARLEVALVQAVLLASGVASPAWTATVSAAASAAGRAGVAPDGTSAAAAAHPPPTGRRHRRCRCRRRCRRSRRCCRTASRRGPRRRRRRPGGGRRRRRAGGAAAGGRAAGAHAARGGGRDGARVPPVGAAAAEPRGGGAVQ